MKINKTVFVCLPPPTNKIFSQTTEGKVETVFETLIFPTQSQHTHGSSLVSLPNGDILSAWFQEAEKELPTT
jgi:hypothetical protein